ncbi:MAG: serine/threonine protein kinase [Desulfobulbaceae bacterium]|nr:serine/threonine protein kinase [Desulfobulbaceae bacterium]
MGDLKKLGKYTIQSTLGQGAMGVVYMGFDPNIERTVAIKTIRKDALSPEEMEPLLTRFKREAQAAGRLTHPGIVTVYEYGEEGGNAFIAMEYVHGRELKDFLDKNERFPLNTIISIITQLLDALTYSHAQGVVHRDIKPGNIILCSNGQIKVMDFGIARLESSTLTQFGDVVGTPSYMSPEQFSGQQVDKRSDLFSTGVILYHLLTGEKPFPGNSMTTIMHRVINTEAPLVSDLNFQVPTFLDSVILKALAKKPDQRFQTAEEFKATLTKVPPDNKDAATIYPGDDDTVMISSSDPTVNLHSDEIPIVTKQADETGNNVNLQEKFDKIVDLLESQGVATNEDDQKLYKTGRKWVLTLLVVTILSIFGYTVWTIYSEDLTYKDLEQIVNEKVKDISASFSDQSQTVVEISQSLKHKPTKEFPEISGQQDGAKETDIQAETTPSVKKSSKQGKELSQPTTPVPKTVDRTSETAPSPEITEKTNPPSQGQIVTQKGFAPGRVLKEDEW